MRAPVYRNIEAQSTFLGLSFPTELGIFMLGVWALLLSTAFTTALLGSAALYAAVRLSTYRRPPLFLQHALGRLMRRWLARGRLSAAARGRTPRFPFGPYVSRDSRAGGRRA